jgi:hypothetical protein
MEGVALPRDGSSTSLLRRLFLKPAETVIEALRLRDHDANLFEYIFQSVLVAEHDCRQNTNVVAHLRLIGNDALKLLRDKFEGDGLGHGY